MNSCKILPKRCILVEAEKNNPLLAVIPSGPLQPSQPIPQAFAEDDPTNPKNWSSVQRWTITILFSCFTLISPMSSSMVAPALDAISHDLDINSEFEKQMVLSLFLLVYGLGPLIAGPLSEMFGRIAVLYVGNSIYIAFNAAGGAAQSKTQMLVFRAFSGFGAGAPLALGAAVISDLFGAEERGKAVAIYNMAPLLGPSLGPLFGAVVTQYLSWPWVFYIMSIGCGVLMVISFFFLRETFAPLVLSRKYKKMCKHGPVNEFTQRQGGSFIKVLGVTLWRPLRMLFTQPIIQFLAAYVAYLYGMMYLVLSTFPDLWVHHYHESVFIGGLNYISLGLGFLIGSQLCALAMDRIFRRLTHRNGGVEKPEFRLPLSVLSTFLVPAGLFIYAWSAQYNVYWIVPNLGAVLFSMGVIIGLQCSTNYLIDTYSQYTASAIGAITVLRGIAGFGFPLFAPYLYKRLGYGWGNSLLAFIALAIGTIAPAILWTFGERIRSRSTFGTGEKSNV